MSIRRRTFTPMQGLRLALRTPARRLGGALLLCCLAPAAAPACVLTWQDVVSSSSGGEGTLAYSVKTGPDGSQFVTGQFSGSLTASGTTLTSSGGHDAFLAKYGASGNLLWIVKIGGTQDDTAYGIDVDSYGNAYVTGYFIGTATLKSANGATTTINGTYNPGLFLAKYNASGRLLWVQTGVTPGYYGLTEGNAVAVNVEGGAVYVAGRGAADTVYSSADGTTHSVAGAFTWHMTLAKYDTDGNFKWAESNSANPNSMAYGVAVDGANNAYVTGWMENWTTFSSADGNPLTIAGYSPGQSNSDYPGDAFLVKYDSSGNAKWVNHVGGYKAIANAVAVSPIARTYPANPNAMVTIAGFIGNIDTGSVSEAHTIVSSQQPAPDIDLGGGHFTRPYNRDAFVATYDAAGHLLQASRYGGTGNESAHGVTYYPHRNGVLNGVQRNSAFFVSGVMEWNNAAPRLFVQKSYLENSRWVRTTQQTAINAALAGNFERSSPALSVDRNGNVFVAGGYQGTASFGPFSVSGGGSSNFYLAKLAVPTVP